MTKEQLEKIRKRKHAEDRIVYAVFDNDEEATALHIVYDNELFVAYMMLERVYETKEEAEWHNKTYAERTERFEPPMWEDIKLPFWYRFVINNFLYVFDISNGKITLLKTFGLGVYHLYDGSATKENYEKACEIVRDLFRGGK